MKVLQRLGQLSAIALAGFLCVSTAQVAAASQAPRPVAMELSHSPVVQANYYYHGRHYSYRYHGRYFNHRRFRRGHWHYY